MILRRSGLALFTALLCAHPAAARTTEPPEQYCRRVASDDTLRPIPASLIPAARRSFGLNAPDQTVRRMTVFRCMDHAILICSVGANLPCGKANTARHLSEAVRYCAANPGAALIPMFVTGHDTIYRWRCSGPVADPGGPVEPVDGRGFLARFWKAAGD